MRLLTAVLIVFLSLAAIPSHAESKIYGKVIGVTDGDTITVLTPMKAQIKVRLAEIDAPEKDQPYGQTSKKFLSAMVFNKEVTIFYEAKDRYGRMIGRVWLGKVDVNLQLVRNGTAWAYRKYLKDEAILKAEEEARNDKVGLWGLQEDQIMAPWEWRHKDKKSASPKSKKE